MFEKITTGLADGIKLGVCISIILLTFIIIIRML